MFTGWYKLIWVPFFHNNSKEGKEVFFDNSSTLMLWCASHFPTGVNELDPFTVSMLLYALWIILMDHLTNIRAHRVSQRSQ